MPTYTSGWLIGAVDSYGSVVAHYGGAEGNRTCHKSYWQEPLPHDRWWYTPSRPERIIWHNEPSSEDVKFAVESYLQAEGYDFKFIHVMHWEKEQGDLRQGQWHGNPRIRFGA